jgi:PKHD-type hydroxylase
MNTSVIFPPETVDLQNYYFFSKGFSDDELAKIYRDVASLPFREAATGESNENTDKSIRSSSIKWIPQSQEWAWLYDRMLDMAMEANNALWKFDLHSSLDNIQYTEYYDVEGGHYGWHQDIGPGHLSTRKVSITVQLSDDDEYEGGDLEYWRGGTLDNIEKAPRGKGVVFIFPSFMMHRVAPITKGTRRSFVLWVGGSHYK